MLTLRPLFACGLFLFLALSLGNVDGHDHGHAHDHGHSHEEVNPAFKYSRTANEDPIIDEDDIPEEEIVNLPPQKAKSGPGHAHNHGHVHEAHGHAHGGGGCSGHSHGGGSQPPVSEAEREALRKKLHQNWDDDEEEVPDRNVWFQAITATLLISAAPFFILFFVPLDNSAEKQWLLKIVLSFASGGLLGDAFLHLIPHAQSAVESGGHGHSHSHGHSHGGEGGGAHDMSVGLGVVSGIVAFLCVEKMVRIFNGPGGHGHSHAAPAAVKPKKAEEKKDEKEKKEKKEKSSDDESKSKREVAKKDEPEETSHADVVGEVKVAGYLNLFADTFHNFTDGLAIGASFIAGEGVGKITTLTILLHEVPHEVGDYAILIQSGMAPRKAMLMQLVTAGGALTGCIFALVARGTGEAAASFYILPFTAGGFIYIATVSVIPELLVSVKWKQSILEVLALLAGVGMMVIIAQYE